jgi:hypothetical protein
MRLLGHRQQLRAVERGDLLGQPLRRQLALRKMNGRAVLRHEGGVVALVRGGADDERHQHAGHAGGAQLAHRHRAGAADDEVATAQPRGHVVDERQHVDAGVVGLEPGLAVQRLHVVAVQRAGLMRDARARVGRQQRKRLRQGLVEHLRAEAAADHQ